MLAKLPYQLQKVVVLPLQDLPWVVEAVLLVEDLVAVAAEACL